MSYREPVPGPFLSPTEQGRLVESNLRFAHLMVRTWAPSLAAGSADYDDAHQAALVGLWQAARRFDPSAGFKFRTLATWKCRSRISDFLRRRRARGFRYVPPGGPVVGSLDAERGPAGLELADVLAAADEPDPDSRAEAAAILAVLPDREFSVLVALFIDQVPAKELADRMGISRCRVGQLKRRALGRIRERARVPLR